MKKLILLSIGLALFSCSTPNIQEQQKPLDDYAYGADCGVIVTTGEDQRGDYICVKMPGYSPTQKDRYQVNDYQDYQLNQHICDFKGLTKQPL